MIKGMALKGGNKFSLILGLGLGIVAAVLIAVYLSGAKSDGGGGTVSGPSAPVVVAASDIPVGTRIESAQVTVKDFPEGGILPGHFGTVEEVVGQVTTVRVVAGEQVIADKITGSTDVAEFGDNPPLALTIPQGMRGSSVEINAIVGAGGNLRTGDHVDVLLSIKYDDQDSVSDGKNQATAIIVQNLQVLAIDQTRSAAGSEDPDEAEEGDDLATTVTLLTTPVQAELLALADTCRLNFDGRIGLAVRGIGDATLFSPRGEWPSDGSTPDCFTMMGLEELRS